MSPKESDNWRDSYFSVLSAIALAIAFVVPFLILEIIRQAGLWIDRWLRLEMREADRYYSRR